MIRLLTYVTILTTSTLLSQGFGSIDQLKESPFDTLHVYSGFYQTNDFRPINSSGYFKGVPVQKGLISQYGIDTIYPAVRYTVPRKIIFNTELDIKGYILCCETFDQRDSKVVLVLFDKNEQLMTTFVMAYHTHLQGTMQETKNSWIFDQDGDGDLDLLCINDLVDYETPNEYADNITGVRYTFYELKKDEFVQTQIESAQFSNLIVRW